MTHEAILMINKVITIINKAILMINKVSYRNRFVY